MERGGDCGAPTVVISGSLAYDHIMTYPGSFQDHIIPGKVYVLSVSFLYDSMRRDRGGVAGNVGYSLALLGEHPALVGAGGADFADYRLACESIGIDMSHVVDVEAELTGSSFMTTDLSGNQIAGFYPGASNHASELSVLELGREAVFGFVGPTTLEAMRRHAREFAESGCRLIYDPSQQVVSASREDLLAGIEHAWALIGSDYEMAVIEQKTGLTVDDLAQRVPFVGVTLGKFGSELRFEGRTMSVPAAPAERVGDPTGGGDAYRAGLMKGLMLGLPLDVAGRMGSLAATYSVERHGPQEQYYTANEFVTRFDQVFPEYAGAVDVEWLQRPVARDAALERLSGVTARGD
ncbi:MAG: PfkB domain protein [Thermomicrobiales bacterium]|jgi:adenosine kinase|nr:PfkB domain protein [Thermomicrobiales bacterium]